MKSLYYFIHDLPITRAEIMLGLGDCFDKLSFPTAWDCE